MKYKNEKTVSIKGLFIWCLAVGFYFYECFLRVFPNTLSTDLMNSFHINAEHFSILSSVFFLSYALMQTPVGIIVYKYGIKRPLVIATLLCAFSVFGFALSTNLYLVIFFRFLMGVGSAFGYISLLSLALNWFPPENFGFFTGLSQLLGSIGPLLAGAPLAYIVEYTNKTWRFAFFYLALFGVILAFLYIFFIQSKPKTKNKIVFLELSDKFSDSFSFLKKPQIIFIIIYTALIYVAMPIIGSYWGCLYLQARGFSKPIAALVSSMIWIGYSISSPIIGKISDLTKRRVPLMIVSALIGFLATIFSLYLPFNNFYFLALSFILIGVACAGQSLAFATITENVPHHLKTTMLGINNTVLMLCGAFIPLIIGALIHPDSSGKMLYSVLDFKRGLFIMPIIFIICFFISLFFIKETYCRSKYEIHFLKTNSRKKRKV